VTDDDRFKLLYGPYRTPRVRVGEVLSCEYRDCDVIVTGFSDAPIPWPLGRRRGRGARGLVVFGALAEAVRRESAQAVGHWFGVDTQTVWAWRRALGVPRENEGTTALRQEYGQEAWFAEAQRKAVAKAQDPERRAKIAASRRGKPRRPEDMEPARAACRGKPLSEEHRQKLSAAQRRRGARPPKAGWPWSAAEDQLLRTLPAAEVVRQARLRPRLRMSCSATSRAARSPSSPATSADSGGCRFFASRMVR
jgi:hypothetical protein